MNQKKKSWSYVNHLNEIQEKSIKSLIEKSYAAIGIPYKNHLELNTFYSDYLLNVNDQGKINAFVALSRAPFGLKGGLIGSDSSLGGVRAVYALLAKATQTEGILFEVSGDVLKFFLHKNKEIFLKAQEVHLLLRKDVSTLTEIEIKNTAHQYAIDEDFVLLHAYKRTLDIEGKQSEVIKFLGGRPWKTN